MKIKIACLLFLCCFGAMPAAVAQSNTAPVSIDSANRYLARTLNVALTFDAPKEGAWGHTMKASEFKLIKDVGFTAVRLAIQWVAHMDSVPPYKIDPQFLKRIDWAIAQCRKNHLAIVLDNHLDEKLMADPAKYHDRAMALWQQLSIYYERYPQTVMFELMAEPHSKLTPLWNGFIAEALGIIRKTNPVRPVIVGSSMFNIALTLYDLKLPDDDKYIIVTVHYYDPVAFTMQGEKWFPMGNAMKWIGTKWMGTDNEKAAISGPMHNIAVWAAKKNRPIFWGEFGASDTADVASKARYFAYIREQAEANHFSWGYFNFCVRFSLYDIEKQQWHEELLEALIPQTKKGPL